MPVGTKRHPVWSDPTEKPKKKVIAGHSVHHSLLHTGPADKRPTADNSASKLPRFLSDQSPMGRNGQTSPRQAAIHNPQQPKDPLPISWCQTPQHFLRGPMEPCPMARVTLVARGGTQLLGGFNVMAD